MSKSPVINGTPWHVEIMRKDEDDQRRHPSHCIYYGKKHECTNGKSPYYILKCGGAARCNFFKEEQIIVQEKVNLKGWSYDYEQKERMKNNPVPTKKRDNYYCVGYDKGICRITYCSRYKKVCMDKKNCLERTSVLVKK